MDPFAKGAFPSVGGAGEVLCLLLCIVSGGCSEAVRSSNWLVEACGNARSLRSPGADVRVFDPSVAAAFCFEPSMSAKDPDGRLV